MHTIIFVSVYLYLAGHYEFWRVESICWMFPPLFWIALVVFIGKDYERITGLPWIEWENE